MTDQSDSRDLLAELHDEQCAHGQTLMIIAEAVALLERGPEAHGQAAFDLLKTAEEFCRDQFMPKGPAREALRYIAGALDGHEAGARLFTVGELADMEAARDALSRALDQERADA